jgi:hypothetical protein
MSSDPTQQPGGPATGPSGTPGEPTEEELRGAYEAELSRITPADMMLQAAVSLLNIGARRLGLTGGAAGSESADGATGATPGSPPLGSADTGRDLEQVRDAIDGVRALLDILERTIPQDLRPLREALSQLQMAYAREAQAGAGADSSGGQPPGAGGDAPTAEDPAGAPGPAQSSGRLWVPGS